MGGADGPHLGKDSGRINAHSPSAENEGLDRVPTVGPNL